LCKKVDFPLTFENTGRKSFSTPEQFEFVKKINNAFICLDTGHLFKASSVWGRKIEIEDWVKKFPKKILTLHLHNVKKYKGEFQDHLSFSIKGLVKLEEVFRKVKSPKFVVLETFYSNEKKKSQLIQKS